jgi:hypothetical protein
MSTRIADRERLQFSELVLHKFLDIPHVCPECCELPRKYLREVVYTTFTYGKRVILMLVVSPHPGKDLVSTFGL